jgi:hypothetical protein
MSKGLLVFAYNNKSIDYIQQAAFLAKRAKEYLDLPLSIVTDDIQYAANWKDLFDEIIFCKSNAITAKTYNDGTMAKHKLVFKNDTRPKAYDLTPYEQTVLLDTDYISADDILKNCFDSPNDFMIYKDAYDLAGFRDYSEFKHISDVGVEFYWATCVYFNKCETNKTFFDLVQHVQTYWTHYRQIYRLETPVYRNDHIFSIAIHIMNGFKKGDFAAKMPGRLYYTTDKDILHKLDGDEFTLLLEKENRMGQYTLANFKGTSLHVMNKFSLAENINV